MGRTGHRGGSPGSPVRTTCPRIGTYACKRAPSALRLPKRGRADGGNPCASQRQTGPGKPQDGKNVTSSGTIPGAERYLRVPPVKTGQTERGNSLSTGIVLRRVDVERRMQCARTQKEGGASCRGSQLPLRLTRRRAR